MYLEQKNYNKETIKEIQSEQKGVGYPIVNGGYPTFNTCDHTTLDLSHLGAGEEKFQHTLSVKVDDDRYVTLCFLKLGGSNQVCLDVRFHGKGESRAMHFKDGKSESWNDIGLLALINEIK